MTPEVILYGRAFVQGRTADRCVVAIQDGKFVDVARDAVCPAGAMRVEGVMLPGFIDTHVHGAAGADFMDGDRDASLRILNVHAQGGTTALAATTLSASRDDLQRAVRSIAAAAHSAGPGTAEICAVHLEGPYINADRAGAQAKGAIRRADIHELNALHALASDLQWIVTIAPEIDGARAAIEHFSQRIVFSVGHTSATYGETVAAVEWGARHFTHLFNAMTGLTQREPGVVGAALTSTEATAELIADGIHVHPAVLRLAVQVMPGRIALVTDAVRACGMPDGTYDLYDQKLTLAGGAARLADGTLAGSVLTMIQAVRNMVELAGLPFDLIIPMATEVPARILNVQDRKGKIEAGFDADLVIINERFEVMKTIARGVEVWRS